MSSGFDEKAYQAEYRKKNKEKLSLWAKNHYSKNRKKLVAISRERRSGSNREKYLVIRRAYMSSPKGRLSSIKGSAGTRGISFSLKDSEAILILKKRCFYCGTLEKISIDRLDSDIGYTKENSVPCCATCNYMKRIETKDVFIAQCKKIAECHA